MNDTDWVYDIETFFDIFCVDLTHVATRTRFIFEVSDRRDQSLEFGRFVNWLSSMNHRMFGYNNVYFDWPVVQYLVQTGQFTAKMAHDYATQIIQSTDRFAFSVWPSDRIVTQGDLFLIHHFDNVARSTSLKKLEINMRSSNVVDLPYPPDQPTTSEQKDHIIRYMCHDVSETLKFYMASLDQIKFRDELTGKYPDMGDVLNFNDTKIGKKFFERELERHGTPCYQRVNGRHQPIQTWRKEIALRDVISPRVTFQHPEFLRIKSWLESQVLRGNSEIENATKNTVETKGVFKDVNATIDGFTYDFGTGGIHGSLHSTVVEADDEWEIWDWDVASYYPNLAISNGFYPAHLSEKFCEVYSDVYRMRQGYKKGTAENAMLKLALNGVYGDSNNKYSPFYDPQYTMAITINGQLMLCMLAEWLTQNTEYEQSIQMIQINTDGLTVKVRKNAVAFMRSVCAAWEQHTGLELESAQYSRMWVRDVNSYIAEKTDGSLKRIGAYTHQTWFDDPNTRERGWHQDHSALVVRKAAEAFMVRGTPLREFIMSHPDPMDFVLSVKVPRSSRLEAGGERVQNTTRYYVSTDGVPLTKIMPPLKGKSEERRMAVQSGWTVKVVNNMDDFNPQTINWYYYLKEAEKLVI